VTVATGGTWSGGTGTFSPNANALNATYTPSAAEITAGTATLTLSTTGNGNCTVVTDQVILTFTPAPIINAGANQGVCANNAQVILAGAISNAGGGTWTGGNGVFFPDANSLGASYNPSAGEIAAGSVTLTLTTTGNGNCFAESDQMTITITPAPVVNAGSNLNVCSNNNIFSLSGSVLNAGGGTWSGGNGTYDPSPNDLNPAYTPTIAELFGGSITFTLTSTSNGGCLPVTDQVVVTFTPSPTAAAGQDQTLCASAPNAALNGSFTVATGGQWSGGNGSFSPSPFLMTATYIPTAAEISAGSVVLTLSTIGNGNCLAVTDEVTINFTPVPSVNAGANLFSCANNPNVDLNGSFANAGGIVWSGGLGFYNPNNTNPSAIYTPSNAEIINGSVTLTITSTENGACAPATDQVIISISPSPVVNAGTDITLCANNSLAQLNGTVQFAGGGQWSGGLGVFTPSGSALSATYQATAAEIAAGFVTLTLGSTGNGSCNPVSDQVTLTFTPAPIADAGADITACVNNAAVQLSGSFTVAEGASWSGGAGSFSPGSTSMNAIYAPTQNELNLGTITLTLTTFGNSNCLASSDQVTLTFTPAPEVEAGADIFACVDALTIPLSGAVTGPTNSGVWSTSGTGTFVPNQFNLNASYIASSQDSLIGQVVLTLTSTNNGLCTPVPDALTVFINPAGTANAGNDQTVCANNSNVQLTGIIGGAASTGFWETSGSGIFTPSANVINPTYLPSEIDIANGSVVLTFFVNSCNQASDSKTVTINPAPVVDAGSELTACAADGQIQLSGVVSGVSSTGQWTSSGTGSFSPSPSSLDAIYIFSAADIQAQAVELTLAATNIGTCVPVSQTITLNIFPQGVSNAGADITACANNAEAMLSGVLSGADQGVWSSSGTGSFSPNSSVLNPAYIPSQVDINNGSVNLVLTATNSCNPASDFLVLNFTPAPVVDAGPDQEICGTVVPFQINGSVSNAGGGQWSTSGSGTFQNAFNLSTFYVASQDDIDDGGIILTLTSTNNGNCLPVSNSMTISISSGIVVNAGPDREACATSGQTQLFGNVSTGTTSGQWTTTGNGSFTPSADNLNAIYNFTPEDIASGSVVLSLTSTNNGICEEVSDSFVLTFGTTAFVFAGVPITFCETQELIQLNGQISGETTSGIWTTTGGGVFFPTATSLNASYEPGDIDIANGSIELTLTSTGSNLCAEGSAILDITLQPEPTANAGSDVLLCGELLAVQLLGSVSGATGGTWSSSGSGIFSPDANLLTATYLPSSADSTIGNIQLTLTTTGNGFCASGSDVMNISFSESVIPNAGPNQELCEDTETIDLSGQLTGNGTVEWSTSGSGSFESETSLLNTSYTPSVADLQLGNISFYLSAETSGSCPGLTDSLVVTFDRLPQIEVAATVPACTTTESISLSANVAFQDLVSWSSTGGGSFTPNPNVANVQYSPTAAEIASGSAQLTISATSNGACGTVSSPVTISFVTPAMVNAGIDLLACADNGQVALNGTITGSGNTGVWSTAGFGSFIPDESNLSGAYIFGSNDILLGFATLTLTSTNNGPCAAVTDNVLITINPAPVVNAGNDLFACSNAGSITLNGTAQNTSVVLWSTSGDGVFLPSDDELAPEYIIGVNDQITGVVELTLTAQGLEGCGSTSATVELNISTPLIAGFNLGNACAGAPVPFTDLTQVLSGNIVSWQWTFGDGNTASIQNPSVLYNEIGSYTVQLVVQSNLGCRDTTSQVINVLPAPVANFTVSENPASIGFDITFENASLGAVSYQWDMGDGFSTFSTANVEFAYPEEGNFIVSLTAIGQGGCQDSTSQIVNIDGRLVLPPRLPNTFSPNNDGLNDVFYVRGGPFSALEFRVYNGWGQEIFSTIDQELGWDGTQGGEQLPLGIYVYTIKATTILGASFDYSGKINLIR
jgi:gliding motility-associated-like protein